MYIILLRDYEPKGNLFEIRTIENIHVCIKDLSRFTKRHWAHIHAAVSIWFEIWVVVGRGLNNNNNNNNYDNLYGAVTRPYRYKGASQTGN